jgi:hypothetical protein
MSKSSEEKRNESGLKARWESPVLQRAGHLGTVLQAKCLISADDSGIEKYKTPGHDPGQPPC